MLPKENSTMRLQAAVRLMDDGESLEYAAGLYSLPVKKLRDYLAGLSYDCPPLLPETNTGVFKDTGLPVRLEPPNTLGIDIFALAHGEDVIYQPESILPYYVAAFVDEGVTMYKVVGKDRLWGESAPIGSYAVAVEYAHKLLND